MPKRIEVGEGSPLENPFTAHTEIDIPKTIKRYRHWLNLQWVTNNASVRDSLKEIAYDWAGSNTASLLCTGKSHHLDTVIEAVFKLVKRIENGDRL